MGTFGVFVTMATTCEWSDSTMGDKIRVLDRDSVGVIRSHEGLGVHLGFQD